jgi:hypothetical protein
LGIGQNDGDKALVVKQPIESLVSNPVQFHKDDNPALTFAHQLRERFANCKLTYHATPDAVQGRLPYWWAEVVS